MAAKLVIAPGADGHLNDADDWYATSQEGLGETFLWHVESCIQSLLQRPHKHAISFDECRRALVGRFRYMLVYRYAEETVTICGVFHASQDPNRWRPALPYR